MSDILVYTSHNLGDVTLTVIVNGEQKAKIRLSDRQIVNMEEHFNEARRFRLAKPYGPPEAA